MFKRRYFDKAGTYRNDLFLAEDTLLWYYGFLNDCKFANIDIIGLKYRRTADFYKRRANRKKTFQLLKFRISVINKNLKYGVFANIYAYIYFFISISPSFIKKILYKLLR